MQVFGAISILIMVNEVDLLAKTLVRLRREDRRNLGRLDSCCITKVAIFRDLLFLIAPSISNSAAHKRMKVEDMKAQCCPKICVKRRRSN
jgi:hypothetical protein